MVFFFEKFFGAGFGIGGGVESVLVGVGAGRGVVGIDGLVVVFFEGGFFGGGEARSFGAV